MSFLNIPNYTWQAPVDTVSDLPLYGSDGDARIVLSTYRMYVFNSGTNTWSSAGSGGASDSFYLIQTDSGTYPTATSSTDTLTFTTSSGSIASFVGNATTDTVTLSFAYTPENVANKGSINGYASLDASGLVPITQIPPAALERLVIVADQTARYALTTATVQNGDTVKQVDTDTMYFVSDDTNLGNASGYTTYAAGTAASVPYSGVTGVPTANTSTTGVLTSTDWNTFNGKQAAGNYITALTGDVTASGPGSASATIANSAVTLAKMANLSAYSLIGNNTSSSATPLALQSSIKLGTPSITAANVSLQKTAAITGYYQDISQNTSNGTGSSTDYIVSNDLGTDTTYYGDFGINSSTFTGTGSLSLPNATYLYSQSGDLVLGTYSANSIHLLTSNAATDAITIDSSNNVKLPQLTVSRAAIINSSGFLTHSTVTDTELSYSSGVTSSIQTQLNAKATAPFIPDQMGACTWRGYSFLNNSTTVTVDNIAAQATNGSPTARAVASTNLLTRTVRLGIAISTPSANAVCGLRTSSALWAVGSGFKFYTAFAYTDTAYNSGALQFYGMTATTGGITISSTASVSSLLNMIGIGSDSGDTALSIFQNDGTGTATKTTLSATDFPANRTAGAASTDIFSFMLYNAVGSSSVLYQVTNLNTGVVATGTLSSDLPSNTTLLCFQAIRTSGSSSNAGSMDLTKLGCFSLN